MKRASNSSKQCKRPDFTSARRDKTGRGERNARARRSQPISAMPEVSLGHDARDRSAAPARADHGEKHVRVPGLQPDADLHLAGVPDGAGFCARRRRRLTRLTTRGFISRLAAKLDLNRLADSDPASTESECSDPGPFRGTGRPMSRSHPVNAGCEKHAPSEPHLSFWMPWRQMPVLPTRP
jgi:hypothetical protein